MDIESFVGDPHCTVAKLNRFPILILQNLVVLEAKLWITINSRSVALRCESTLQGANRTRLAVFGQQCTAGRAGPIAVRFHNSILPRGTTV